MEHAFALTNTKHRGAETRSYQFLFCNGLSAAGVWAKAITTPEEAPATIVLSDQGKKTAAPLLSERLNRREQVLAADLLVGESVSGVDDGRPVVLLVSDAPQKPDQPMRVIHPSAA